MNKFIKYGVIALAVIVLFVVVMYVYRVFFKFKSTTVNKYIEEQSVLFSDANKAYQLIKEGCEYILKSQDLTKQVEILASIEGIEREKALVITALNNCYASGMLGVPSEESVTV